MDEDQLRQYTAARNGVALFDFSRSAKFEFAGKDVETYLNRVMTLDVEGMRSGKAANTVMVKEDGTIVAIVWLLRDDDAFLLITDPEKRSEVAGWLEQHRAGMEVEIRDKTEGLGCLSIVGPKAQELARTLAGDDIIGLPYLGFEHNETTGCVVCRIGYTGEYEYRFIFPVERLHEMRTMTLEKGQEYSIEECQERSLNVLMLEMKSINQARDLARNVTLLQAGLHWAVDFRKESFIGREAIMHEKGSIKRKLLLLVLENGAMPDDGAVLSIGKAKVGAVVNRAFSPTLNKGIALGLINEDVAWVGISFDVEADGGRATRATACSSPLFLTRTVTESVV